MLLLMMSMPRMKIALRMIVDYEGGTKEEDSDDGDAMLRMMRKT